jgi:TonB C terminal
VLPAQRRRQPCTAVERVLAEYESEIARLIQDLNRGAVDIDRPNTAVARFLIASEGERGKRLLRQVSNRDFEQAATTALEILEGRQPLPLDRPADWV